MQRAAWPSRICATVLDLVGLATVCDVVPLTGVNRAFVRSGAGPDRQAVAARAWRRWRAWPSASAAFHRLSSGLCLRPAHQCRRPGGALRPGRRSSDRARSRSGGGIRRPARSAQSRNARRSKRLILEEAAAHGRDAGQCALRAGGGRWLASRRGRALSPDG